MSSESLQEKQGYGDRDGKDFYCFPITQFWGGNTGIKLKLPLEVGWSEERVGFLLPLSHFQAGKAGSRAISMIMKETQEIGRVSYWHRNHRDLIKQF